MVYCCTLNSQSFFISYHKFIKAFDIFLIRLYLYAFLSGKDFIVQILFQSLSLFFVDQVGSQYGNTPGPSFSCSLHYGYRSINSCCQDILSHAFGFEETSMSQDLVQFYPFLFQKDIHTCL